MRCVLILLKYKVMFGEHGETRKRRGGRSRREELKEAADGRGECESGHERKAALETDLQRTFLGLGWANASARKERPVQGVQPMSGAEHAFLLIDRASFLQ
jgi:hypothetical protein